MRNVLFAFILIVSGLFVWKLFLRTPNFTNGTKAPLIKGELIDGSVFSLENLKGNYVLVDFWGSWCAPCIREIPELKNLYQTYHNKKFKSADNFHILSIALEKSDKHTMRIIEKENLNWPHHIVDVNPVIMLSRYARQYNVKNLPTKYLLNPEGEIIATNLSFPELSKMLDARLK